VRLLRDESCRDFTSEIELNPENEGKYWCEELALNTAVFFLSNG